MNDFSIEAADWSTDESELMNVRYRVFVKEQQVPADLELDGLDNSCRHVKARNENGVVIATARLLPDNHIGRMCVLKPYRNKGIGGAMLQYFIDFARHNKLPSLMLNAQLTALPFYRQFGFVEDSEVFMEADIEHVHMTLSLAD